MTCAGLQISHTRHVEYAVYTFEKTDPREKSAPRWTRQNVFNDMSSALQTAESLYGSGLFEKIEIKQKYFDERKHRYIDATLRVLENRRSRPAAVLLLAGVTALSGLGAFAVACILHAV